MNKQWRVSKLGHGTFWFPTVEVLPSGALRCWNEHGQVSMYFGPGMWVTASFEEKAE